MLPEAEQLLRRFYEPFNTRLAAITGDSRYLSWNEMQQPAAAGRTL